MSRFSSDRYRLVDRFDSSYWSGKDVTVFAEDVLIDDALQITFQVMEQVRPYYHYSHFEATRIHHGTRTITGELTLNFKRSGYMYSLLSYLRQKNVGDFSSRHPTEEVDRTVKENWYGSQDMAPYPGAVFDSVRPVVPFATMPWGPVDLAEVRNLAASEVRRILDQKEKLTSQNTKWVEQADSESTYAPNISVTSGVFETRFGGFDLNIIYGGSIDDGRVLRYYDDDDYALSHSAAELSYQPQVGTGLRIVGVELMGSTLMVDDSGRPLTETYAFMARSFEILRASEIKLKED
jgi:hypothetical protein